MGFLAEAFAAVGGVPVKTLTDRMGCLKGGVVANVVIPTSAFIGLSRGRAVRWRTEAIHKINSVDPPLIYALMGIPTTSQFSYLTRPNDFASRPGSTDGCLSASCWSRCSGVADLPIRILKNNGSGSPGQFSTCIFAA